MSRWSVLLPLILTACVARAPRDVDALSHFIWDRYEGRSEELADALRNFHAEMNGDTLAQAQTGRVSSLTRAQVESLAGLSPDLDPSRSAGFFFYNVIDCSVSDIEMIMAWPDQAAMFPSTYDSFSRSYEPALDDYLQQRVESVTLRSEITDTVMDATYDTALIGQLRSFNETRSPDGEAAPLGRFFLMRNYQPEPARFRKPGDSAIQQDYHIDAYYSRADGKTMHLYLAWGQLNFGVWSVEADIVLSVLIGNLKGWDAASSERCRKQEVPSR